MDPTDIGLFRLAEQRLAWVDRRQQVLAQNIANAATPGYQARDIPPFEAALAGHGVTGQAAPLGRTDPAHLAGSGSAAGARKARSHARAPDGNRVSMEEQLGKVADTASTQELVTNLYRKYQGLFRTVLGRNG